MAEKASAKPKATISAKVTRADGTVEDLGQITDVDEETAERLAKQLRKLRKD